MPLFKEVKKPVIKAASPAGADISPLRPIYVAKTPPCAGACPCGTDIRGWLTTIAQAEAYGRTNEEAYRIAWEKITERNPFPAVCGRVCPHLCEDRCNRQFKEGAVNINALERFIGDFGIAQGLGLSRLTTERRSERVAVVGAGPAGLSCAYQLTRRGYPVTVFEAFDKPGGMLRYGIPKYRLPREILDAEIQRILDLGVRLQCGAQIGPAISLEQLRQEYKAVFVGIGAHRGLRLGVPGEEAPNVFTGTEFLNHVNSGEKPAIGGKVLVIGGGDTAIDSARVAKRLGAAVTILYRRTRSEMPAIKPEIDGALEEGVEIQYLTAPVQVLLKGGAAVGARCIRMELGAPDASGRPRPVPIRGSEFDIEASAIISAISQEPQVDGLALAGDGGRWIGTQDAAVAGMDGVFAGGDDIALGLATIAIAQGRFAAEAIDGWIRGVPVSKPVSTACIGPERIKLDWYQRAERHERQAVPPSARCADTEIQLGLTEEEALGEAKRCMSCGMCMDCETCWMYCTNNCFVKLPKGEHYKVKLELCNGCKKCAEACPCGYIELN
jgi:NADPH-dependent glutamate synthase beta subunit-like oxidoreductase/Pyruvate/2-oxoacid:ferredoxin oxidoreductase delta subunit